jgi:hypothetical protein
MEIVQINNGEFIGEYFVYDNVNEAQSVGIKPKSISNNLEVDDWVVYSDGRVAKILKKYSWNNTLQYTPSYYFRTCLNSFWGTSKYVPSVKSSRVNGKLDLSKITKAKVKFVEDWLFHGYTLEESAKRNLKNYYHHFDTYRTHRRQHAYKMMGHEILNGEWFDKLLSKSRVIRDRYMDIISAFKTVGLDETVVATRVKQIVEDGEDKDAMAAIRWWHEVNDAENNRKGRSIPDALTDANIIPFKSIPEKADSLKGSEIPDVDFEEQLESINNVSVESINIEEIINVTKRTQQDVPTQQVPGNRNSEKSGTG